MAIELYVKFAVVNFDASITDSQDLSTIRGSSVAALRFAPQFVTYLAGQLGDGFKIEPLYSSASEGVARVVVLQETVGIRPPRSKNKNRWRRELESLANRLRDTGNTSQAEIADAARQFWNLQGGVGLQLDGRPYGAEIVAQALGRLIAAAHAPATTPLADLENRCALALKDFMGSPTAGWPWNRLTVVITAHHAEGDLAGTLAALDSKLRTRQLHQLTVPVPDMAPAGIRTAADSVCAVTGVLPADPANSPRFKRRSRSVIDRRRRGVDQRQYFYEDQFRLVTDLATSLASADAQVLNPTAAALVAAAPAALREAKSRIANADFGFAESFDDIVKDPPPGLAVAVQNKLAVVHVDGNGFGARREERARLHDGFAAYRRFSLYLDVAGGLLLARLLDWMMRRETMWTRRPVEEEADKRLRFETILWGGDEMCFVLPAWEAWDFAGELVEGLSMWSAPDRGDVRPLTFGIGLVYGHVKTPIRDLRRAADGLCQSAKADRLRTCIQAMTLEGIDRADNDPAAIRREMVDAPIADKDWIIDTDDWRGLTDDARRLLRDAGAYQLHRELRQAERCNLLLDSGQGATDRVQAFKKRLSELGTDPGVAGLVEAPRLARGAERWPFLPLIQLVELGDFIMAGDRP